VFKATSDNGANGSQHFPEGSWTLARNFPNLAHWENFGLCSGTCVIKATSDNGANGSQHFPEGSWTLARNFPNLAHWNNFGLCSGTCVFKATSDNGANGNQHFPAGSCTLARNFPNLAHWKILGYVLGPVCSKPPQIMEPMETNIFQKGPGPWPEISPTGPTGKFWAMFWDLCVQSQLR